MLLSDFSGNLAFVSCIIYEYVIKCMPCHFITQQFGMYGSVYNIYDIYYTRFHTCRNDVWHWSGLDQDTITWYFLVYLVFWRRFYFLKVLIHVVEHF